VCLGVNFRPSRLRTPTKGRLTRAIMECGHDAPAPQSNENMTSWLSRCVMETAGSSTANEDLWEDHPDDLQDEGDEDVARLAMEWRRDNAAEFDKNYSWQPSVKVDRCAGDRWNVWHHDGDGKWAHSVALRMSNGVGLGLHELTFAEHDARVVANTMSEESQTALPPVCLSATDSPVFVGVRHRDSVNGHSASVLGWNRLEKHLLLKILLCLGPGALWNSGKACLASAHDLDLQNLWPSLPARTACLNFKKKSRRNFRLKSTTRPRLGVALVNTWHTGRLLCEGHRQVSWALRRRLTFLVPPTLKVSSVLRCR
jgi:hypothetical protein